MGGDVSEHTAFEKISKCLKAKRTIERNLYKESKTVRYSCDNKTVEVWEANVNASLDFTGTPNESGNANTQITVSPNINATATNFLAIIYKATATSNRIWGGTVTIAPQ